MKIKKYIICLMAGTILLAPSLGVAESKNEENDNPTAFDYASFMANFDSMLDDDAFGEKQYDLPAESENIKLLNLQYKLLADDFANKKANSKSSLDIPVFETGYSTDIQTVFKNAYGDVLKELALEKPEIPDTFTPSKMLDEATKARDQAVNDFKTSSIYKSVSGQIEISSIFKAASQKKEMPALDSTSAMTSRLNSVSEGIAGKSKLETDKNFEEIKSQAVIFQNNVDPNHEGSDAYKSRETMMEAFKNNTQNNQDWLSSIGLSKSLNSAANAAEGLFGRADASIGDTTAELSIKNLLTSQKKLGDPSFIFDLENDSVLAEMCKQSANSLTFSSDVQSLMDKGSLSNIDLSKDKIKLGGTVTIKDGKIVGSGW